MLRIITAFLAATAFLAVTAGALIADRKQYDGLSEAQTFDKIGSDLGKLAAQLDTHAALEASTVMVKTPGGKGSGVYIGDGRIVSATHVTIDAGPSGKVQVFSNTGVMVEGTVLWEDENSDVSLIKLNTPAADVPFNIGTADLACGTPDPQVGEPIEVVGNPLDMVNIHTFGRVASVVAPRGGRPSGFVADVTIAPGNSGGPVFDSAGRVAGFADELPYGIIPMAPQGAFPASFALAVIVPRSEICKQLAAPNHPKPLTRAIEK